MSWSHSSRLGLVLAVALLVATAGVAAGVTIVWEDVPEEPQEAGTEVTFDVGFTDTYADHGTWELQGETQLENAQWEVQYYRGENELQVEEFSGSSFSTTLDASDWNETHDVYVVVTGDVPEPQSFSYQDGQPADGVVLTGAPQDGDSFDVGTWTVDVYTQDSREARSALEDARSTIDGADGDVSDAEATWEDAVAAFEAGDFSEATSLAQEAESQATSGGDDGSGGDGTDDSTDGSTDSTDGTTDGTDGATDGSTGDDAGDGGDSDDDGGIAFTTVLMYVLGFAVLVGAAGGVFYLAQQNKGPNRDPLG